MQSGQSGNRLRISGETKVVGHPFFYSNPSSSSLPFQPFSQLNVLSDSLLNGLKKKKWRVGRLLKSVSHSVMSDSLQTHGQQPTRLFCPQVFPGKNTGVGCHSLLQGIFQPRDRTWVSCFADRFFTIGATREAQQIPILSEIQLLRTYFKVSLRLGRASK